MSLFSKNLRFLRKKGAYNQDEISILFQKRANTIGNWENQKSEPNLAELIKLGEFFNVNIQDLLHTDLQRESLNQPAGDPGEPKVNIKSYPVQEPVNSTANEGSPDTFWLILKELKALNAKMDSLVSDMQEPGFKKNSDKSYH